MPIYKQSGVNTEKLPLGHKTEQVEIMSLRKANVNLRSKLTNCVHAVATHREVESAQAPEQIAALREEADMSMYLDWNSIPTSILCASTAHTSVRMRSYIPLPWP
ncbi:hypothetical protein H9Q69_010268 [Fusarium xylarioides]|uniref:Uncharacterized protein n=1 Tax=Fusarium xylarioides TaxID=221167 RepID=A0A9P7L8L6_9HYPO|nr:hypothetical protein H9Q70_009896 [Fusarium xylarioides]KAG5769312.1 hypothetical protein H9Q72_003406 [Fusarium xylarioides]KAG5790677.1 hypothetical protein H9Q69_010268 [Fusarium xylarioides]